MPREAKLWTETLIVMLIIAVMLVISWSFKQKRETFIADNKAETNASYEFTSV
jgi:flagellar basal body-associated protein FliL